MTGSVQHIRDDRWRVVIYTGLSERTGKPTYKSRAFRAGGKQEAEQLADPIKSALRDEIKKAAAVRGSVAGAVNAWLEEKEQTSSPTTMTNYRRIGAAINEQFGRMKMDELKPRDVRLWYARLGKGGMSQASIAHYHSVLRAVCRQAWFDEEIAKPATAGLTVAFPAHELDLPTNRAMLAILAHATDDLSVAFLLAAATGMRRGELVALRWSDLRGWDLRVARALIEVKGAVRTKVPKGRRARVVTLDYQTMRMLARHRSAQVAVSEGLGVTIAKRADRAVFANLEADPHGQTPYRPGWLSHGWERTRKAAGAEGVTLHSLRHWHATNLLDAGLTEADVADRLGHADPGVTMRVYAHSRKGRGRLAATAIGQAMKASKPSDAQKPPRYRAGGRDIEGAELGGGAG